jgi:hypothetical protein
MMLTVHPSFVEHLTLPILPRPMYRSFGAIVNAIVDSTVRRVRYVFRMIVGLL